MVTPAYIPETPHMLFVLVLSCIYSIKTRVFMFRFLGLLTYIYLSKH